MSYAILYNLLLGRLCLSLMTWHKMINRDRATFTPYCKNIWKFYRSKSLILRNQRDLPHGLMIYLGKLLKEWNWYIEDRILYIRNLKMNFNTETLLFYMMQSLEKWSHWFRVQLTHDHKIPMYSPMIVMGSILITTTGGVILYVCKMFSYCICVYICL